MRTVALEIHDAGLLAVDESGVLPDKPASPGYAFLDGGTVYTGHQAADRARLKPRFVHRHFWQELDSRPLPRPFPRELSAADLAHAHLGGYWRALDAGAESVLLTVPGTFSEAQLGLVLGIARACEIPVDGMVDAALAAASGFAAARVLHLDLQLHRLVATEVRRHRDDVVRRRLEVAEEAGLAALQDALGRRVAELFVHETRFDPLHSAASEQELYRRLPELLEALRRDDRVEVSMEAGPRTHAIEVDRESIATAIAPIYDRVVDVVRSFARAGDRPTLLVTHRLARLPGFAAQLDAACDLDRADLPEGASGSAALRARDAILAPGEEALPFVVRLPVARNAVRVEARRSAEHLQFSPPAPQGARQGSPPSGRVPTHLVKGGLAYPISGEPFLAAAPWDGGGRSADLEDKAQAKAPSCRIFAANGAVVAEPAGAPGVSLNGAEISGRVTLAAGDLLRIGETRPLELLLIAVVE
jgi:hypothetical protein